MFAELPFATILRATNECFLDELPWFDVRCTQGDPNLTVQMFDPKVLLAMHGAMSVGPGGSAEPDPEGPNAAMLCLYSISFAAFASKFPFLLASCNSIRFVAVVAGS